MNQNDYVAYGIGMPAWRIHLEATAIASSILSSLGPTPEVESSQTSAQDRAEFHRVDITTRHDADDLSGARLARQGTSDRAGPGARGDNAVSLGEQADSRRHFGQLRHQHAVDQLPGAVQHLGENRLAAY